MKRRYGTQWRGRLIKGIWLGGLANDGHAQIGLALLMGLASKTGGGARGGPAPLPPILMTSFAFVLGSLPLVFATGAGAATVVGGCWR